MNLFNRYIIIPKRLVQRLYILIFAIVPLIDSMNGYFLKGGFEGSLTIGSIYRMVLILFVACAVIGHLSKRNFICLSIIIGYFIFACIIQKVSGINSKSLLSEYLFICILEHAIILRAEVKKILRGDRR